MLDFGGVEGEERCGAFASQASHGIASQLSRPDLWQRLAEKADAAGVPPPGLNLDAALWEVLRSDDIHSVCWNEVGLTMRRGSESLAVSRLSEQPLRL